MDRDQIGIIIRNASASDLVGLAEIQAASPEAAQWNVAEYFVYDCRVAETEGRLAGFLVCRSIAKGQKEILNFAVRPEYRGRGIGRLLLSELLASGEELFLELRASNLRARQFYELNGFQQVGSRREYYHEPVEPAIVMKFCSC